MVDFQARDTRRGPTSDDGDDESTESDTDGADDAGAEPVGDGDDAAVTTEAEGGTPTDVTEVDESDEQTPTDVTEVDESDEQTPTDVTEPQGESGDFSMDVPEAEATADDGEARARGAESTGDGDQPAASKAVPGDSAAAGRTVDVAVVTVGTEPLEALEGAVTTAFESAGHRVATRERPGGGYDAVREAVESLVDRGDVDVVVTAGGVGVAPDDLAIEAVHPLLEKALPGFGETLRSLLFEHVGTGIVGVRSAAGVADGTLVFCLPGDAEAAGLAVEEILATEAPELASQLD